MTDSLHLAESDLQFNSAAGDSFALSDTLAGMIMRFGGRINETLPPIEPRLIISRVVRRLHTPRLFVGDVPLDSVQARHARDVLRLAAGTTVEVFDNHGTVATGSLMFLENHETIVRVTELRIQADSSSRIIVASAVPKGERADWMIEKLSELGVAKFIPLAAERSVVLPEGRGKFERWGRIATESAKQSRRAGVMAIAPLMKVDELLATHRNGIVLSTASSSVSIQDALKDSGRAVVLVIGPEGGWTNRELEKFASAEYQPARITLSILRIETAAVAAAAIAAVTLTQQGG
jgi:16S rRNA (uracil1498-N3)-methyltransferase